jgi:hypothetical protein
MAASSRAKSFRPGRGSPVQASTAHEFACRSAFPRDFSEAKRRVFWVVASSQSRSSTMSTPSAFASSG